MFDSIESSHASNSLKQLHQADYRYDDDHAATGHGDNKRHRQAERVIQLPPLLASLEEIPGRLSILSARRLTNTKYQ